MVQEILEAKKQRPNLRVVIDNDSWHCYDPDHDYEKEADISLPRGVNWEKRGPSHLLSAALTALGIESEGA